MGKGSPSAPPAPDPAATANAQAAANIDAARAQASLNRVDQYTPTGNITYRNVGAEEVQRRLDDRVAQWGRGEYVGNYGNDSYGKPIQETWITDRERAQIMQDMGANADRWEAVTTLSPEQQRILDLQQQGQIAYGETAMAQMPRLQELLSQPFSLASVGDLTPTITMDSLKPNIGYGAESRARVEQALMDRLNPSLMQQRDALDTRLRNQGLTPGSEAWATGMREQSMSDTDARLGVIAQGGQEETTQANIANMLFGQELQRGQVAFSQADQSRQRMIEKLLAERQIPLNEISALLGGPQVSMPQFQQAAPVSVTPADYTSAVGMNQASQNTAYQGKVANQQANNATAAAGVTAAVSAAAIIA